MVSNDKRSLVLLACGSTLLSGAAWWFGTGLAPLAWLTWLAPLPLLWVAPRLSWRWTALGAFCAGACAGLNLWHYLCDIIGLPPLVGVTVAAAPALTFMLCTLLYRRLFLSGRLLAAALATPVLWVAIDKLSFHGAPHGTFGSLAYYQMDALPVIQLASVTGIWGISFVLLLFPSALAIALSSGLEPRQRWTGGAAALLVLGAILAFGYVRLQQPATGSMKIGLASLAGPVQAPLDKPEGEALLQRYLAAVDALAAQGARTIVLPEAVFATRQATIPALAARAARHGVTIDIGVGARGGGSAQNTALAFAPSSTAPARYAKHHLIPGLERQYAAGTSYTLLTGTTTGLAICKDMDFHDTARAYADRRANLLLVPAWDFGADGWLHSRMAVLRGVEGGFAIARAARRGRLTLSDDRGRIVAEADDARGDALLVGTLPLYQSRTLFMRWGDWFAWLDMAVLLAVLVQLRHAAGRAPAPRSVFGRT